MRLFRPLPRTLCLKAPGRFHNLAIVAPNGMAAQLMDSNLNQWIQLTLRWTHVFAAIMWVGTTFFFTWLDGRFTELVGGQPAEKPGALGESDKYIWMVHSGGFYRVDKQKVPAVMPEKLHWFKWEAAITWLSGILLFFLVYYHGGLMVPFEDSRIRSSTAVWLSMALLVASWPVYNFLWFRLVKNEMTGVVVSFAIVVGLSYCLTQVFAGRAAYLQLGGMFGTIMASNVWMRILPAQRRMVAALRAGQAPDQAEAAKAKACSKHNTFMAVAAVFTMISNHFPSITYGRQYSWAILSALVLAGWAAAMVIRRA